MKHTSLRTKDFDEIMIKPKTENPLKCAKILLNKN